MWEKPIEDLLPDPSEDWSNGLSSLQWESFRESIKSMNGLLLLLQEEKFQFLYSIFFNVVEFNNISERDIFRFMVDREYYESIKERLKAYFFIYIIEKFEIDVSFELADTDIYNFFDTIQTLVFQMEEFYKKWGRFRLKISRDTLDYLSKKEPYLKTLLDKRDKIWWHLYEIEENFYYIGLGGLPFTNAIKNFAEELIIYNLLGESNSIVFILPESEDVWTDLESLPLSTRIEDGIIEEIFANHSSIKTNTIRFLHTLKTQEDWNFWIRTIIKKVIDDIKSIREKNPNIDIRPIPEADHSLYYDFVGRLSIAWDILCDKLHNTRGYLDWVPKNFGLMSQTLTDAEKEILIDMAIEHDINEGCYAYCSGILEETKYGTPLQQKKMIDTFSNYWAIDFYPESWRKKIRFGQAESILKSGRNFSSEEINILTSI